MREALKRLTGESLVYGLGQVGGRAVQLLLVPLLTRLLPQGAFGISDLVTAYMQTATLVLVFGMDGALARFIYHEPDRQARIRMISSSFIFRVSTSAVLALVLSFCAPALSERLLGGAVYEKYFRISAVTLPFTMVMLFSNDVLRVTFQPWKFITLNLAQTALTAAVTLWFLLERKVGVVGVFWGRLFGDGACALLGIVLIRHTLRPHLSREALGRMLRYGGPIVPAAIAWGAITSLDRYALQRTRSLEEVGTYAISMKFFSVVAMGVSAFQLAYGPFAFARAASEEAPRLFARVLGAFVGVAALGAMLAGLFAPEAVRLVAPSFRGDAAFPAAWLGFAAVALGAYTISSLGVSLALKTPWLLISAVLSAAMGAGMNAWLTPRYGPVGAAMATTSAYLTLTVVTYVIAQRFHPLPYRGARMLVLGATALVLTLVVQRSAPAGPVGWLLKVGTVTAMAALMTGLGIWKDRGAVAPAR